MSKPVTEYNQINSNKNNKKWIIIDDKLYDVSEFYKEHPGGPTVLLTHIGKDASDVFHAMHPESAYEILANYYIGDLNDNTLTIHPKSEAFANDIRQLRDQLEQQGYFEASKLFYLYKMVSTLGLCFVSMIILYLYGRQSSLAIVISAFLLGVFWQQCGWLSHDFGHHQVFTQRVWNDMVLIFLGNFCQGFALSWWKNKHNTHHASTNISGHDPDIDTAPILLWDEYASANYYEALGGKQEKGSGGMINRFFAENVLPHQTRYFFFVLGFARASWALQSLLHIFRLGAINKSTSLRIYETVCLILHWGLFILVTIQWIDSLRNRILFFVLSQSISGYMLAIVFALNHNGMPVISQEQAESLAFFEIQVITGRDVKMGCLGDWFMGGLNYQIEHHVFPTLPRHRLADIQPKVEAISRKHGIQYHTTTFMQGSLEVLKALDIAQKMSRNLIKKSM
ncbi:delta-6 fatty acid desaturase [Halteromyces radiatus]|uniref:delta-6 fatty acid desaturase n=1 Tax=Halteromyces radiatus TaxID=101107 RepID=UPI0022205696|nr:delta-6 fatty acid desaturase [Halteromyces radiatus]KAI8093016.1 delta-6 fatty acid desaturase [Halteromyces radiatus]